MADSKIYLGSIHIGSLFEGASDISIYLGEEKVYPLGEPSFKWKATYSDSSVTSAECDSSSAITEGEINLTNLVSVEIGDCVDTIDGSAFQDCSSLTSINIPSGVTTIGSAAFQTCTSLTSVTIPDSVTSISVVAFFDCTSLTNITVNAVTPPTLGPDAFRYTNDCPIYVPCESVEAYKSASGWSTYASRIVCPPFEGKFKATYSSGETYELDCDGDATLSNGNTKPSGYQTSAMTEAIIGDCVTEIGEHAFYGYSGLTSVSIPDSVTTIGIAPFQNCYSLTSVTIPSGVTFIGNQAFVQCTGLTSVTCLATTPPTLDQRAFNTGNSCPIYVPSASVNAYKTATVWSGYASRIQAIP